MLFYQLFEFKQMRGPFLDLAAAKLAFNQGIASVRQMQYDVRLKAVPVPIVGNVTILIHRVGTKVTHTHLLEQKTERFQLCHQDIRR